MKSQAFTIALLLLAASQSLQASPPSGQGLRLLLGDGEMAMGVDPLAGGTYAAPGSLNLNFSQPIGTYTNFFGSLSHASQSALSGMGEVSVTAFQGGIEWFFGQQQKMQWFLLGGMGGVLVNDANKGDVTSPVVSFGLGQNWAINTHDALRWELRANQSLADDHGLPNWTPVNFQAIFTYQWGD